MADVMYRCLPCIAVTPADAAAPFTVLHVEFSLKEYVTLAVNSRMICGKSKSKKLPK